VKLTTQAGARDLVRWSVGNLALTCWLSGDWDDVEVLYTQHYDDFVNYPTSLALFQSVVVFVRTARDEPLDLGLVVPDYDPDDLSGEYMAALVEAQLSEAEGDVQKAARAFAHSADAVHRSAGLDDDFAIIWPFAIECVLAAGDTTEAERLLSYAVDAPPGLVPPLAHAHLLRLRALIGIARGDEGAAIDADLELATKEFRDFGARFYVARTLLEQARRMSERGDEDGAEPLRAEAEAIFVDLKAKRWVAEARRVSSFQ